MIEHCVDHTIAGPCNSVKYQQNNFLISFLLPFKTLNMETAVLYRVLLLATTWEI